MRLIDADALKENIQSCDRYVLSPMITSVFLHMIDNQPTVKAESVKYGHWEYRGRDTDGRLIYKCSECGYTLSVSPEMNLAMSREKFCYSCGARMDGGSEEE